MFATLIKRYNAKDSKKSVGQYCQRRDDLKAIIAILTGKVNLLQKKISFAAYLGRILPSAKVRFTVGGLDIAMDFSWDTIAYCLNANIPLRGYVRD